MLGIDFTQVLQRKGRTGAVAQQPFQSVALVSLDAHLGIDREAAAVFPRGHHLRIVRRQQAAPLDGPQQPSPYGGLNLSAWFCVITYQAFLQKANKAGIEVEPYLTRTLSIVLGCRVFNETGNCAPLIPVMTRSGDKAE